MDRVDAWRIFAEVASRRSFVAAARALGRSPQAVTRAVAALEDKLGARLLHRTTRSVSLTDEGARSLARCRAVLADFDALESPTRADAPLRGTLSVAAPVLFGQLRVLPVVTAFLRAQPGVDVKLALADRVVSLADEGIDVAVRIGALPDSSLRARSLGRVRLVTCASPAYLARMGTPEAPAALARHPVIAFTATTPLPDRWSYPAAKGREQPVAVRPRLVVNTGQAAIDAALAGLGLVRVLSYQVDELVRAGRLRVVLAEHEPAPVPVQLLSLPGVNSRAAGVFGEFAAERLKSVLHEGKRVGARGHTR